MNKRQKELTGLLGTLDFKTLALIVESDNSILESVTLSDSSGIITISMTFIDKRTGKRSVEIV